MTDDNAARILGFEFGRLHGQQSKKSAASNLRKHDLTVDSETVTAWRTGCDEGIVARVEALRLADVAHAAPWMAEAREIDPDWSAEEVLVAALQLADDAEAETVAEAAREIRANVWDRFGDRLYAAGLVVCGASNKSASTYYGRDRLADGRERIRVSDHSVAYVCSDCAVCVEIGRGSPDADVILSVTAGDAEIDAAAAEALALFAKRVPEIVAEDR